MANGVQYILTIRLSIKKARQHEEQTHALESYLEEKVANLHHCIKLPSQHKAKALVHFVIRYIEHVPDFIEALTELSKKAGIYDSTRNFLDIAEDYFLRPPELIQEHNGLHALIDEAYLAHRLLEEINDRLMMDIGSPLAPMDMTLSNIIIHELLGEEFANQLDLAVHYAVESLFESKVLLSNPKFRAYIHHYTDQPWDNHLQQWPCLAGDSSIELDLSTRSYCQLLH